MVWPPLVVWHHAQLAVCPALSKFPHLYHREHAIQVFSLIVIDFALASLFVSALWIRLFADKPEFAYKPTPVQTAKK